MALKWRGVTLTNKLRFDYNLSALLARLLEPWKPERIHGSRDYFQIRNELVFEVVPVLKVEHPSQAVNVTDIFANASQ